MDKEKYEVIGIDIGIDTNTIPNENLKMQMNLLKKFFQKEVVIVKHVILINMDEYRKNEELAATTILIVPVLVIMIAIVFGIIGFIIKYI